MIIDTLVLEVTRRCNMQCMHCLRGHSQNVDMTRDMIDKIFEDIESVYNIVFTGGEPFLNIDIIKYALDVVNKKEIQIHSFFLATNGKVFNDENIIVLNNWMEYVCLCNYKVKTLLPHDSILDNDELFGYGGVAVSRDEYHEPIPYKNYLKYKMLAYYTDSKENKESLDYIINEGLAKENQIGTYERPKTDIYVSGECMQSKNGFDYENLEVDGILYISAIGEVLGDCDSSYETQSELSVGNINENSLIYILEDVLKDSLSDVNMLKEII